MASDTFPLEEERALQYALRGARPAGPFSLWQQSRAGSRGLDLAFFFLDEAKYPWRFRAGKI